MYDKSRSMKKQGSKDIHPAGSRSGASKLPAASWIPAKKAPVKQVVTKDFLFKDFKKVADKAPFTIAEWADILHLSERTLHRYAKENSAFSGLQIELILLTEKLITMGNELFGKDGFKSWLNSSVFSLNNKKPKEYLHSYAGLQELINVIGRIEHGLPA